MSGKENGGPKWSAIATLARVAAVTPSATAERTASPTNNPNPSNSSDTAAGTESPTRTTQPALAIHLCHAHTIQSFFESNGADWRMIQTGRLDAAQLD